MSRRKKIVIEDCQECPFYIFDDGNVRERWGNPWCQVLNVMVNPKTDIPEECPLVDTEEPVSIKNFD